MTLSIVIFLLCSELFNKDGVKILSNFAMYTQSAVIVLIIGLYN